VLGLSFEIEAVSADRNSSRKSGRARLRTCTDLPGRA
jgi:hypothetical protein